jgi:hypothetical protein
MAMNPNGCSDRETGAGHLYGICIFSSNLGFYNGRAFVCMCFFLQLLSPH